MPGDSVYGLSRLIYPHNEKAVHRLALAIVLANPASFPNGKLRPLRVGEVLTLPDLREVQRIVDASGGKRLNPKDELEQTPAPVPVTKSETASSAIESDTISEATQFDAPAQTDEEAIVPRERPSSSKAADRSAASAKPLSGAPLHLKLDSELDLSRLSGKKQAKPSQAPPKRKKAATRPAPKKAAPAQPSPEPALSASAIEGMSLRISRVQQGLEHLDQRITRLETTVEALQKHFAQRAASSTPAPAKLPATPERPRETPAPPAPPQTPPASSEATQATRQSPAPPAPTEATRPRTAPKTPQAAADTKSLMGGWLQWGPLALAALIFVALIGLIAHRVRNTRSLFRQQNRIDEMLERARNDASPLLGSEPVMKATPKPAAPAYGPSRSAYTPVSAEPELPAFRADDVVDLNVELPPEEPHYADALHEQSPIDIGQFDGDGRSGAEGEIPPRLKREMDEALDATRSMYSDVDRFITLGRIANAISLLEFQIKRDPRDRNAWIKLLAVYHQQGMSEDFDRSYANYRELFGDM